ncbi:MAG: cation:proton antiporter [Pyrinomonadaceae bacterium MAG19_C2-C3]|nr:cation:proton antiporter [Pyrinomonadaceae bacterium MAG19_C2-C3]
MHIFFAAGAIPAFMTEVVTLLVAGAVIAYICYRFGLVPIVGFLVAGVIIGPNGLRLVRDQALVDAAAEVGVILLLYTIGIEFSLEKLARIKRLIFVGGGLQVGLATALTLATLAAFGVRWQAALFTGFLVALSSTAIVLKLLADKGETNTAHGQVGLGLLIFQDLAIIVMVLLIPVLSGAGGSGYEIFFALTKAGVIIAIVLLFARRLMPPMLEMVARTCSPELFLLTVIAICFGTAYLTSLAGVSLSLGAFLAGLLVSESRFSEHALSEILPLQILFSATFFVSVGMLLDVGFLINNLPLVVGSIGLVLVIKIVTTGIAVRVLNYKTQVAAASGLMLAQIGEFSFVLERAGREAGLSPAGLGAAGSQTFIASSVVLMVLTPLLMRFGSQLAGKLEANQTARSVADIEANGESETMGKDLPSLENHVIVAGYGRAARALVRVLGESRVPFIITTLSPEGANEAESEGLIVLRGDSTKQRTLELVGIARARVLVVADDEPIIAGRIASVARTLNSNLRVIIRTRYAADINSLAVTGANHVISEEQESIIKLFSEVLSDYDFTIQEIARHETSFRRDAHPPTTNIESHQAQSNLSMNHDTLSNSDDSHLKNPVDTERVIELRLTNDTAACSHVAQTRPVVPGAKGCEECLRIGDTWVHLRVCMTCGHVGCCESSKNKHALQHYTSINHPIVASLEANEDWAWCYTDKTYL